MTTPMTTQSPKTVETLQQELATLEAELAAVNAKACLTKDHAERVQKATSGHLLGNVTLAALKDAQDAYDEALAALARRPVIERAVADQKAEIDYARAHERAAYIAGISAEFIKVRDEYVAASKVVLELFRRLHQLDIKSQSMHSRPLMDQNAYRLDLPAIRREADSELFTVGQMLRDGSY